MKRCLCKISVRKAVYAQKYLCKRRLRLKGSVCKGVCVARCLRVKVSVCKRFSVAKRLCGKESVCVIKNLVCKVSVCKMPVSKRV